MDTCVHPQRTPLLVISATFFQVIIDVNHRFSFWQQITRIDRNGSNIQNYYLTGADSFFLGFHTGRKFRWI